jgi:probable HAF family extracellular repeat protein
MTTTSLGCAGRLAPLLVPAIVAATLACRDEPVTPTPSGPESEPKGTHAPTLASGRLSPGAFHLYSVVNLGTLGGTVSAAEGNSENGWISGFSTLSGDEQEHAVLWRKGRIVDLGTLGGPNSSVGAPVYDNPGWIAGLSETSGVDPFSEDFCGRGTNHVCRGFLWRKGALVPLPTLGGNNGWAFGVNNSGQAVGFAENEARDPNCVPPQVFDFRAVIWGPRRGVVHELPPLPGDAVSVALGINNRGQVVGGSGSCGSPSFALSVHAVLWQNGGVIDLGSFGGQANNYSSAINDRGEIVGASDLPGDATGHAFLWRNSAMLDLGTLPGDLFSVANGVNDAGQVVGVSCDADFNCRAFLWEDGLMTDLNTLISPQSPLSLIYAGHIDARGEIVGQAFDTRTSETPAFVAFPQLSACTARADECIASAAEEASTKVVLPPELRARLGAPRRFGHALLVRP